VALGGERKGGPCWCSSLVFTLRERHFLISNTYAIDAISQCRMSLVSSSWDGVLGRRTTTTPCISAHSSAMKGGSMAYMEKWIPVRLESANTP
jgi:hypothetical protein